MNLLLVHNFYQQPGGEDQVFAAESRLMKDHGHHVLHFTAHNNQITQLSRLALARSTIWNSDIYRKLRKVIQHEKPDIMHVHNTVPLISPAVYYAAKAEGITVVQTLHNYRMLCPNATFFRDDRICEDCMGKLVPWPGLYYACYRKSRMATTLIMAMLSFHRLINTWGKCVDVFIVLSSFARQKFIDGGLPEEKIIVKPNFVDFDYGVDKGSGRYALFVGRLSPEKGIDTLLATWKDLGNKLPLKIVGDGPISLEVAEATRRIDGVEWLGQKSKEDVLGLMKDSFALIFPSIWYEGLPMAIIEAYSVGLPVIASNLGSMSSMIEHGRTGLHFRPGDRRDLAEKVNWAINNPKESTQMRLEARQEYLTKYTAELNYKMLMKIYRLAMK